MKSLLVPKKFLALSLLIILLSALIRFELVLIFKNLIFAVGTAFLTDFILLRARKIRIFPVAGLVSGLIIALLFSPDTPWYIFAAASFLAMAGKNVIHIFRDKHVFNPAAAGIFLSSLIFGQPISWWGPSWGALPLFLIVVLIGYLVIFRMRRFRIPLFFLATYLILNILISQYLNLSPLFDGTVIFFALVMLPEPMTSPADHKKQIFYGAFVAIAVFLLGNIYAQFHLDPLISSLLLGNLVFRIF